MIKGLMKQLRAAWEFFLALVTRFREERVTQTSGSLTYTTLLSLVPFFTVALAITTAFPVFDEWIGSLQLFVLENVLPDTPAVNTIIDQINSFTQNAARLTAIGIIGFLVTSVMLMLTVDNALNRIFRVQRRRTILQNIYIYWAVITLGPLLIGASLSMTYFALRRSLGALDLGLLADALGVLGALARAHQEGRVVPLNTLAREYRILPDRCEQILERAAALGWAARTERDGWVLARDAATIRVAEIYRAFVFDADAVGVPEADLGLSLRDFLNKEKSDEPRVLPPP